MWSISGVYAEISPLRVRNDKKPIIPSGVPLGIIGFLSIYHTPPSRCSSYSLVLFFGVEVYISKVSWNWNGGSWAGWRLLGRTARGLAFSHSISDHHLCLFRHPECRRPWRRCVGDETHWASAENPQSYQRVSDNYRQTNVGDFVGEPTYHRTRPFSFAKENCSEAWR